MHQTAHRRQSIRLATHDYSTPGAYFVTICTYQRQCVFGTIVAGQMHPNQIGQIVAAELERSAKVRTGLLLDQYIVMPNHLHAIFILQPTPDERPNHRGNIVKRFKAEATKRIRQAGLPDFRWQRNYYDHVIRNEHDLQRVREYIINNPARWGEDINNPAVVKKQTIASHTSTPNKY